MLDVSRPRRGVAGYKSSLSSGEVSRLEHPLRALIRNEGLTVRRIELDGGRFYNVLATTDPHYVYGLIVASLEDMEQDQFTDALTNAFCLGEDKIARLSDRRMAWAARRGYQVSEHTVRRWENKAVPALASRMALLHAEPTDFRETLTRRGNEARPVVTQRVTETAALTEVLTELQQQLGYQQQQMAQMAQVIQDLKGQVAEQEAQIYRQTGTDEPQNGR